MEEEKQSTTEQTAARLRQFHEKTKRQPKEPIHSDNILIICAYIIIVVGVIASFIIFNGIVVVLSAFVSFTTGVLLYTIARIYTILREIRDNHV